MVFTVALQSDYLDGATARETIVRWGRLALTPQKAAWAFVAIAAGTAAWQYRQGDREDLERPLLAFLALAIVGLLTLAQLRPQAYYVIQYQPYLAVAMVGALGTYVIRYLDRTSTALVGAGIVLGVALAWGHVQTEIALLLGGALVAAGAAVAIVGKQGLPSWRAALISVGLLLLLGQAVAWEQYEVRGLRLWLSEAETNKIGGSYRTLDEVVGARVAELAGDGTALVYGARAWIYVVSDTSAPSRYHYTSPLLTSSHLSAERKVAEVRVIEDNMPMVVVEWSGDVETSPFGPMVAAHYEIVDVITVPSTWPYTNVDAVRIFRVVPTPIVP